MTVVCLDSGGYLASLEVGKTYEASAGPHGFIRVIDESGEAYLYPAYLFGGTK
jgi:hypothetical protein